MCATPPGGCSPGTPVTTPTSPAPSWRPAPPRARPAVTSASSTPGCTTTAASAPRRAGTASRPAGTSSPPSPEESTDRSVDSSGEGGDEVPAGLLAVPARLGADAAVVVHPGVLLALVTAGLARGGAGLQDGAGEVGVVTGVPGEHPPGGVAHIRAVQVGADARGQLGDHVLAEAGVGAGGTGLGALEARLDTGGELVLLDSAEVLGVGLEHLAGHAHGAPSFWPRRRVADCPRDTHRVRQLYPYGFADNTLTEQRKEVNE